MFSVIVGPLRTRSVLRRGAILGGSFATTLVLVLVLVGAVAPSRAAAACANPVACENQLPGDPASDWQVGGTGDQSLQGYATSMSVNVGQTESFKIDDSNGAYHIDILRLGYYGGDGARKLTSGLSAASQNQPNCNTDASTGLIDCGNWSVSASWAVPTNAVSGLYIAHLVYNNGSGSSQIPFVVRNDASHSNILVSTSDATWEAYNDYGGNSLYSCTTPSGCPTSKPTTPGGYTGAFAVSYNRPFDGGFTTDGGASYLWYAEYQMIRFLEENGYDVSYTSSSDVDRAGSLLLNHNVFLSSAHDEYWSAGQRGNVTAARNAGVNLAFFSGNEVFWKTSWSSDDRTLTTYKETHYLDAPTNPQRVGPDPPTWLGAWADPRGGPPGDPGADGGQPQNALTGQLFIVNAGTSSIVVPSQYSQLRMWRNTGAAGLSGSQTDTLGTNTLGYEWDVNDNTDGSPLGQEAAAFRPPGEIELSQTTVSGVQAFTDYGTNVTNNSSTETHHLTLYRSPSGALVFGAGTVQWSWGLDNTNAWNNAGPSGATDPDMQQATVNLLADMCAQPTTLMSGLLAAGASTDTTSPTSTITSVNGSTVSGTARDTGGGVVAGVEVSTDGGSSWHPATLTTTDGANVNWTYSGSVSGRVLSRATNDSGYTEGVSYASRGCSSGGGSGGGNSGTGGSGGGTTCATCGGQPSTGGSTSHTGTTSAPPSTSTSTSGSSNHKGLDKGAGIIGRTATETTGGRLTLWIANANPIGARGSVKLSAQLKASAARKARTTQIGAARFNIPGRAKVKVTIVLSKQARGYLAKHKSLQTRVVVILSGGGTSKTASVTIVVKAAKRVRHGKFETAIDVSFNPMMPLELVGEIPAQN